MSTPTKDKDCTKPCRADQCPGSANPLLNGECGIDARYMCTSGASTGGCHAQPLFWKTSLACDECCDRWHEDSCNMCDRPCTGDECGVINCPSTVPWACAKGESMGGCAPQQQMWSMGMRAMNGQCDSCCDARACNSGVGIQ